MKRREYIKTIALGAILPVTVPGFGIPNSFEHYFSAPEPINFESDWHNWPDMKWVGPEYWGNRLQDFKIKNGKVICDVTGSNRSLYLLTLQNTDGKASFETSVTVENLNPKMQDIDKGCVGFRLGARGKFEDYRSASVFGKGFDIGLTPGGRLKFGEKEIDTGMDVFPEKVRISFIKNKRECSVILTNPDNDHLIFEVHDLQISDDALKGSLALLADMGQKRTVSDDALVTFDRWKIQSPGLSKNEAFIYGPICFAQYTVNKNKLKLTAQFAPIETIPGHKLELQFLRNGKWITEREDQLNNPGRACNFQVENWDPRQEVPYRVTATLPLKNETRIYTYEGTVAAEPAGESLKAAVFSCNAHYGFPDQDIPDSMKQLDYDLSLFLGDQFYEGTGGFAPEYNATFDKNCLDYLRKWMMFGWSYREIFRHKPCAIIPDDHDVNHGNIWGEGGAIADTSGGYGAKAQDSGGYKMSPAWVNMVQFTQTSHLPDPYDPAPAGNDINVYYTCWNYGGISFAILEDRKFKSAPGNVLPAEADVFNGFVMNKEFDIKKYKDIDAELLGPRQEEFLASWIENWSDNTKMKVLLSQTNFATVATLPADAANDQVVPGLYIPEPGEAVEGDDFTVDMDSNGWPQKKRNKALELIRKSFSFHIAGDQHLGTFIQYGIEEYGDSGFAFTGPALNNLWPRRFWPPVDYSGHTYEAPAYTGDYEDGFGNKITVLAAANPHNMHKEPEILHNRANGFGLVSFQKKYREITVNCYKRFYDVKAPDAQYPGWPVTVSQEDQLFSKAKYTLPAFRVSGGENPVIRVLTEKEELVFSLPAPTGDFVPRVFTPGSYIVEVLNDNSVVNRQKVNTGQKESRVIRVKV